MGYVGNRDWDDAVALGDKALRGIEQDYTRGDLLTLRVWGTLQLRAAVSQARRGNAREADDRLQHARTASTRADAYSGPPVYDRHSLTFSTGNVQIHAISVALELSNQAKALELNQRADPQHLTVLPNSRRGHHHMDLARAWLWDGNRSRALTELEQAERLAPQLVRNHPIARATLRQIVYAERTSTRERLRGCRADSTWTTRRYSPDSYCSVTNHLPSVA